jgi:TRAP-type C4-dicarboxylate transport system permease large subunit
MLPARLAAAMRALTSDPLMLNLLIAALLFVVGMFLESNAAYIMLVPLFHPIALAYGLDPLHFGFLFVFNLVLGMLTPPVGVVLFVVCSIANVTMGQIMRHLWPFIAFGFGLLLLCIYWPPLVTGLPRALGY